jgi:cytochrome c2
LAADFSHSAAVVKNAGIVRDEMSPDRRLTNAQAAVPGTPMNVRAATPEDRADIIAFLRESGR